MVSENFDIEFQSRFDELMKARRASVGEIRRYGKFDYRKTPYSWVYVGENKLYQINEQFNKTLDKQIKGDLPKDYKYKLGKPENILSSAGFPDREIRLMASTLSLKSSKKYKNNHPFDLKDVRNLPFALNHPIFIFNSKTQPTSKVVITDLKSNNVNLLIALQIDFKEKDAIVISIRSIYPKESQQSILNWVNEGLLVWRDKKKALKFSSKLQSNSAEVRENTSALFDAVNIIRKFENTNEKDNELNIIKDKLRKAVSEETALEKEVIDSLSLSIQRKKDTSLLVYSSPSFSLPKDTTNIGSMQQFMDEIIEKAKKGSPIGTEKTWGGKVYVKTELGWRPKRRDKSGKEEDKTSKNSSKVNDINSFASKASDEQLQAAIKDKDASPEVKQAAQEELNKRNKKNDKLEIGDITNTSEKKSEKITEEVLSQKLDKLKEDLTKKIDDKLNEINGFKKITQTYVKVDGNTIVLNMKGDDKYKAKKGDFYMESEPHEPLGEFKKRVKEAYENKLKEEKIEQKETTIPTKDKVEDKKKVNRPVAKIQVFTPNGQFLFGDTSKALESGKDIEFTKDKTTYRLIADDLENDVYTLRNQDTGKEVTWKGGLIRLKAQIEEVNKTEQSKSTLRFENEKELKEFIDKRNSLKGLNITNSLKEKLLKSFRKKDSQEIRKDYTEKIKELSQDIKDKNFEKILESYALASNDYKFIINEELINNDYLPVANGILYSEYDGREYRHFDEKIEASLFYKADVNKSNKVEKRALEYYSMTGYKAIRAFNIGEINNAGTGQISSIISSYIDKHPIEDNLVLNRRMEISSNINGLNQWIGAEIGDIVEEKSFASFSLSQLSQFGNDLQITLLAKKGDKVSNIDNSFEQEYLVQKNSKYKVIAKGTNSIVVELV